MPEGALRADHVPWPCPPHWSLLPLVLTLCWSVFYKRCEADIKCVQNPAEYSFDLWPALIIKLIIITWSSWSTVFCSILSTGRIAHNFSSAWRKMMLSWCTDSIPLSFLPTYFHETCRKTTYKRPCVGIAAGQRFRIMKAGTEKYQSQICFTSRSSKLKMGCFISS